MKILIASDKYKGTLSARKVCDTIADVLAEKYGRENILVCPMADGGEGTAEIYGSIRGWHKCVVRGEMFGKAPYYKSLDGREAIIDSSAVIGHDAACKGGWHILTSTSGPLGEAVAEILFSGVEKVIIGVGGTAVCDGGIGFFDVLTSKISNRELLKNSLTGIIDVSVPLIGPKGAAQTLMFAPQKGATPEDMPVLRAKLQKIDNAYRAGIYGNAEIKRDCERIYDGAGGGLGFALHTLLEAKCYRGASFFLDAYGLNWEEIGFVVTGEGCLDEQTAQGKVVSQVCKEGRKRGKRTIVIAGNVKTRNLPEADEILSTSDYLPALGLNAETAERRLRIAVENWMQ